MILPYQHAIITGGSSGIGKALALKLAKSGAKISILARTERQLEAAKAEIQAQCLRSDQKVLAIVADVSDRTQAFAGIERAIAENGTPDLLITSAGIAHPGHFQDLPLEIFEQTMAINYFGSLYSIKAALPAMAQQRKGNIVLISSAVGLIGIYGYTPYSPTKFALRGLAECLRGELKPMGIQLSIVYPPDTDTPQLAAENKTKPLATKMISETTNTWSPDAMADVILKGVQRRSFAITPGLEMRLVGMFHSLINPALRWYFDYLTHKAIQNQQEQSK